MRSLRLCQSLPEGAAAEDRASSLGVAGPGAPVPSERALEDGRPAGGSDRPAVVELEDVHVSYAGHPALEGIHLTVRQGDFLGIIGPNGGGKTTLLRVMLGRLRPTRGRVRLFGQDLEHFRGWARIGYVPQTATHFEKRFPATVEEVVATGRYGRAGLLRRLGPRDRELIDEALAAVGLLPLKHRLIGELSGGQQQRAFIARALAGEPELLILDEPTVGIDAGSEQALFDLLRQLHRERGLTLIMVSHDVAVMAREVTSLACVNRRLVFHGVPEEFLPHEPLTQLYGTPVRLLVHDHEP